MNHKLLIKSESVAGRALNMKIGRTGKFRNLLVPVVGLPLLFTGLFVGEPQANPHTTILKKNNPVKYDSREELEGSGGVLNHIRVPHGCNGKPIKAMGVVFPNGVNSVALDQAGAEVELADYIAGPVITVQPVQDHDVFDKISVQKGVVRNVGTGPADGHRAIHYERGKLQTENVGIIPFDASFANFQKDSCLATMQVNIAIANYCTRSRDDDDRADIWIGHLTPLYDDPAVVVQSPPGFWPQLTVIRDLENNPLPSSCSGEGDKLVVSPSPQEIDQYLPIRGFWPNSR